MKLFKRGQKGFTLVELMVVMAIIAVLAAIVIPPVTGTKQVSGDTQVKQDANTVQTAVGKFNSQMNLAETTTPGTALLTVSQDTSSKWPEKALGDKYGTKELVSKTILYNKDGAAHRTNYNDKAISSADGLIPAELVAGYTAIDFEKLLKAGVLQDTPSSDILVSEKDGPRNYLWLLRIVTIAGEANTAGTATTSTGRSVEVYSLQSNQASVLTYQRIY